MAKTVVKAAFLSLGGTDISAQCDSIELSFDAAKVTTTNFASSGWEESLQGIRNATLNFQLKMDSDLSGIEKTIWDTAIHATTNTLTFEVRRDAAVVGATNPKWTGTVIVLQAGPVLKLGEALGRSYAWSVTGAVTRATS